MDMLAGMMSITKDKLTFRQFEGKCDITGSRSHAFSYCGDTLVSASVTILTQRSMNLPPQRLITHPLQTAFKFWLVASMEIGGMEIG